MKFEEKLKREDSFASWRLATLLAFNGMLMLAFTRLDEKYGDIINGIPIVGVVICLSVLGVSIISLNVKFKLHKYWPKEEGNSPIAIDVSAMKFYIMNAFGPYILSPVVLTIFWVVIWINS